MHISTGAPVIQMAGSDPRLQTRVGTRIGTRIKCTGNAGILIFGPYLKLQAGAYLLEIFGTNLSTPAAKSDVELVVNHGNTVLAYASLAQCSAEGSLSKISFGLECPWNDFEVRVFVDATSDVTISEISVRQVSAAVIAAHKKYRIFFGETTVADLISIGSDQIVVTFQPYMATGFDRNGFGEEFLPSVGYDVLCFKPQDNNWYQDLSRELIRSQVLPHLRKYRTRIGYGSSMGAYGVLYFASELELDRVVALSPQFSVERELVPYELRWSEDAKRIKFEHRWGDGCKRAQAFLVYDPFVSGDRNHIQQLRPLFPLGRDIALPFSGHPVTRALNEGFQLKSVIQRLLSGQPVDLPTVKRSIRNSRSCTYAQGMLEQSMRHGWSRTTTLLRYFFHLHSANQEWVTNVAITLGNVCLSRNRVDQAFEIGTAAVSALCPNSSPIALFDPVFVIGASPLRLGDAIRGWLSADYKQYTVADPRLRTLVGRKHGSSIVSDSREGVLVYGPYIRLIPGQYEIIVRGEISTPGLRGITVRAGCNKGAILFCEVACCHSSKGVLAILPVVVVSPCLDFEVTVLVDALAEARVDSIEVLASWLVYRCL